MEDVEKRFNYLADNVGFVEAQAGYAFGRAMCTYSEIF
jgi:hypothetical protein